MTKKKKEADSKDDEPRRFNQEQYNLLKKCSDKGDITEWNKYREGNSNRFLDYPFGDAQG